ncbi:MULTISPECIES: PilN domain-containing protein [unclassified Serratia (in: enterobacteria)]|uniref:PilN domain-containing protein n=1 Tax=unclassified Serratia (in: enterobacteria) TaxID=2647522 RepID=UPI0030762B9D
MYQVNLLPWRIRAQRQRYGFWLRAFSMQLLVVLVLLTTAGFLLRYQQGQQQSAVQRLTQQHQVLTGQIQQTQQVMATLARLAEAENRRQQNEAHNRRYLSLLQQLSALIPDELWLTALEENAQGIALRGFGRQYAAIALFTQRLAALPLLENHRLAEVVQHKDGMLAFTLTARWGKKDG